MLLSIVNVTSFLIYWTQYASISLTSDSTRVVLRFGKMSVISHNKLKRERYRCSLMLDIDLKER